MSLEFHPYLPKLRLTYQFLLTYCGLVNHHLHNTQNVCLENAIIVVGDNNSFS